MCPPTILAHTWQDLNKAWWQLNMIMTEPENAFVAYFFIVFNNYAIDYGQGRGLDVDFDDVKDAILLAGL